MKYSDRNTVQQSTLHCGGCAYYKKHTRFESPCVEAGAKSTDTICTKYFFDITKFSTNARLDIIKALHLLQEAHVTPSDIIALLFSSNSLPSKITELLFSSSNLLPSKYPLGSRVWIAFGRKPNIQHVCATAIGKNAAGKFTFITESGAVIYVSDTNIIPYNDLDVTTLRIPTFVLDLPEHEKETVIRPAKTGRGRTAMEFKLRGGNDTDLSESEPVVKKNIVKRNPKCSSKRRR